jgi:6-phosphogluconolactonase
MSTQVEVLPDPASACAELIATAVRSGEHVVLTGGSTPRDAYEQVAGAKLDWSNASVWFGDERCVPPDDERSNYGMAKGALLDRLEPGAAPTVHRMKGELGYAAGADEYQRTIEEAGLERFDLLLLGIGPDGHTASLFPDAPALDERERRVVGVPKAGLEPFVPRISLTLAVLVAARHIVYLASGESKAEAVAAAFGPSAHPDRHVPASLVASEAERVTVLADPAAAARL